VKSKDTVFAHIDDVVPQTTAEAMALNDQVITHIARMRDIHLSTQLALILQAYDLKPSDLICLEHSSFEGTKYVTRFEWRLRDSDRKWDSILNAKQKLHPTDVDCMCENCLNYGDANEAPLV
jgi:hypothetical protein